MSESLEKEDLDGKYCNSVAKSIGEIIKYSLNEDFRSKVFKLFAVQSTSQTEKELQKRLLEMIKHLSASSDRKVASYDIHIINKNPTESDDSDTVSDFSLDSSNSSQSGIKPHSERDLFNSHKRSWLRISSEKYKESMQHIPNKRQCFHSQPQIGSFPLTEFCSTAHSSFEHEKFHSLKSAFSTTTNSDFSYYRTKFGQLFNDSNKCPSKNFKAHHSCHF